MARGNAGSAGASVAKASRGDAAPGRGRYDRAATASERARSQRASLVTAAREVWAEGGEITVARLLLHAGCGRNTFYEHFDDAFGAVRAAYDESGAQLEAIIEQFVRAATPRTPGDAMLELAVVWTSWCRIDQGRHWGLLERFESVRIDRCLLTAVQHIHQSLIHAGGAGAELSDARAAAACGVLRAIARLADQRRLSDADTPHELVDAIHDALVRLLR